MLKTWWFRLPKLLATFVFILKMLTVFTAAFIVNTVINMALSNLTQVPSLLMVLISSIISTTIYFVGTNLFFLYDVNRRSHNSFMCKSCYNPVTEQQFFCTKRKLFGIKLCSQTIFRRTTMSYRGYRLLIDRNKWRNCLCTVVTNRFGFCLDSLPPLNDVDCERYGLYSMFEPVGSDVEKYNAYVFATTCLFVSWVEKHRGNKNA